MLAFTYHPSGDPYHCAFRALCLLEFYPNEKYSLNLFRILDFYLLFPFLCKTIRMPRDMRRTFNQLQLARMPGPYQKLPDSRRLFRQIEGFQRAAYRHLAAAEILDTDAYSHEMITRGAQQFNSKLAEEVGRVSITDTETILFLLDQLAQVPLYGPDGLKARTGLMEFRYDVA